MHGLPLLGIASDSDPLGPGRSSLRSVKGFALLVLATLTACREREAGRQARPAPPMDARVYTEADIGIARYHSVDEIIADAAHADGQLALVHVSREAIRLKDFTAFPCAPDHPHHMFLTLSPEDVDRVRALPDRSDGTCPRVLIKVMSVGSTGFSGNRAADGGWAIADDASRLVQAETLAILDVIPRGPSPAPPGVRYTTLLDIKLGRENGGAVAEIPMRLSTGLPTGDLTAMVPCSGGSESVYFRSETAKEALANVHDCHSIRFRTLPRSVPDYGTSVDAELVSVGARVY